MTRDSGDALRNQQEAVRDAADQLRSQIQRVAGNGDGSSWLDQLAADGELHFDRPWTDIEQRAAADLLRVLAQKLRGLRQDTGSFGSTHSREYWHADEDMSAAFLPLNRKERYYTGTVLPMIVASDNFAHLPRLLSLCGLPGTKVELVGPGEVPKIQFFSEYSFAESVLTEADSARFTDRPIEADTPDLVLVGPDWLLAIEAKMFHRPSRQALDEQMRRQGVMVDYWTKKLGFETDRVKHVLLLPAELARARTGLSMPVLTWEDIVDSYARVGPSYWVHVLRAALARYADLASPEPTFGTNAHAILTGQDIIDGFYAEALEFTWVGRRGGLNGAALKNDLVNGTVRGRSYEVRRNPLPSNRNWFPVKDFVGKVRWQERFTGDATHMKITPPRPRPEPPKPTHVVLHTDSDLHVEATLEPDGAVLIQRQDLSGAGEYEYTLRIDAEDVPSLRAALGSVDGPILEVLAEQGVSIVEIGESRWLEQQLVPFHLWTPQE